MTAKDPNPNSNRTLTPLWIVALFVSLTETALGVAVTQTTGGIQVALTGFVIVFPLLIAGGFFLILWHKPYVFYSPIEFGSQVDVRQYVEAMQRKPLDENQLYSTIQKTIHSTLASSEVINDLTRAVTQRADQHIESEVARILDSAASRAIETITEASFLMIDSRPLLGNDGGNWIVSYEQYATVSSFLNDVYFSIREYVPPFAFGDKWVLQDAASGHIFQDIGKKWAEKHGLEWDERSLEAVGILPGMQLDLIRLNKH